MSQLRPALRQEAGRCRWSPALPRVRWIRYSNRHCGIGAGRDVSLLGVEFERGRARYDGVRLRPCRPRLERSGSCRTGRRWGRNGLPRLLDRGRVQAPFVLVAILWRAVRQDLRRPVSRTRCRNRLDGQPAEAFEGLTDDALVTDQTAAHLLVTFILHNARRKAIRSPRSWALRPMLNRRL